MPSRRARTRIYVVVTIALALGFLIPPSINLNHFRAQLSQSLSRSVGRQVSIQNVRLRLLPLPGFTFRQLRIADDEEFGAEPILQTSEEDGQRSSATLRISSLWRGRLEIASISLTHASLNIVRMPDGHWNLERLINRAAQVPSAPTARRKPEARVRFPYIEVKESRINFKFGAEKKPFALSDSEFALWLAAENRWNLRLTAVPLRTDESVSDTGTIKLSGSFDRAGQFSETPFHFQASWERPEVNAVTRIARGHDPGWRGAVELNAELKGTPSDFKARLSANIDEFRRYDIARTSPFDLRISCDHRFRAAIAGANAINQLDFSCKAPVESGAVTVEGELHPLGRSPDFSARIFVSEVPISGVIRALLHAKSTLPGDLTGDGQVSGNWLVARTAGAPVTWEGSFTATKAVLRSRALGPPLALPESILVNFVPPAPVGGPANKRPSQLAASRAVVEPFALNLGGEAALVSATFDPEGYCISVNGQVNWQRLMQVARAVGLHPPATDLQGSGVLAAQYAGEWQHYAPPVVTGHAQIRSAVLSLRGFSEKLHVAGGILKFDGPAFRAEHIAGSFPRSEFDFIGSFSGSRQCGQYVVCDVTFALQTIQLRESAVLQLLRVPPRGISLPFFNSERQFEARWLLEVPTGGTISARHLTIRKLQAKDVVAQLQFAEGKLIIPHWTAQVFDGKHEGQWAFDFSGERPAMTGSGSIRRAHIDQFDTALDQQLGTGSLDLDYRLMMSGADVEQLASSATGTGVFTWRNGVIGNVSSEGEHASPLSFTAWSGSFLIDKQRIELQDSKMISSSGVHEVSGEVSFNRQWNLKFVRANGSGFVASGNITNPTISTEPAKLAAVR